MHNTENDDMIQKTLDRWDVVSAEIERKITLGRVDREHMHMVDRIEERLLDITNTDSVLHTRVTQACDAAEGLRARVRRRLVGQKTVTGLQHMPVESS